MEHCLQLAANKITMMNWEQQKIMHYLIFKNDYVLHRQNENEGFPGNGNFLSTFYLHIKNKMPHLSEQAIKSYVINICVHLRKERKQLLRKVNLSTAYQLRYNLLSVTAEVKANLFDAVTTN